MKKRLIEYRILTKRNDGFKKNSNSDISLMRLEIKVNEYMNNYQVSQHLFILLLTLPSRKDGNENFAIATSNEEFQPSIIAHFAFVYQ